MKRYSKLLTVFFTVVVLLYYLLFDTQVVYASFSPAEDEFQYSSVSGYSMEDDSSIPSGNHFFYHYDSGKAWYCNLQDAITLCCNKSYGISLSPENVSSLTAGFMNYVSSYTGGAPISSRAVTKDNAIVGYALNTLSNCKLVRPGSNNEFQVDSEINNFIYIYVIDYIESLPIDYFNFKPLHSATVANYFDNSTVAYQNYKTILMAHNNVPIQYDPTNNTQHYNVSANPVCFNLNGISLYASSTSSFDQFVRNNGITQNTVFNAMDYLVGSSTGTFTCYFKKADGTSTVSGTRYTNITTSSMSSSTQDVSSINLTTYSSYKSGTTTASDDILTVYRSNAIATQVVNNTYSPSYMTSENTYNYDSNSENNYYNTTTNETNSSTTNNTNIYNEQSENFYDNSYYNSENNYSIDNSQVNSNNTTIINNYYGNGGGGSGGDDDDDDDSIWNALLNAIVDFFRKIGQLIGALLAGLLELINTVLDAFANINNSFEGIKNFLSSIFSWFPSEIVTLMVLGLGLALLASFITWFKR